VETPDSNGTVRARVRLVGLCEKANDIHSIDAGMRSARIA
jgi:hypothetical protein